MQILLIAPEVPLPLNNGGKLRVYYLLKSIVLQGHQVTFVVYGDGTDTNCTWFGEKYPFRLVQVLKPNKLMRIFDFLYAVARGVPYRYAFYSTLKMRAKIKGILTNEYDLCMVEYLAMADNVKFVRRNILSVIDTHNVEFRRVEQEAHFNGNSFAMKLYVRHVKWFERNVLGHFTCILTCSETDSSYLRSLSITTPIYVIPNGVETADYDVPNQQEISGNKVVFIGSLDYYPNIQGLSWFAKEVWPIVMQQEPNLEFHIIGRDPSDMVYRLSSQRGIKVHANVLDVREYLFDALMVVVPLLSGSGTRLKILEAMAANKAVISTTIGAEGIGYNENHNILIADSPDEFARSIIHLVTHPPTRSRLENAAKEFAVQNYDWGIIGASLSHCIRRLSRSTEH